jgi:hypothetical protein
VSLRCFVDDLDLHLDGIEKQIFWTRSGHSTAVLRRCCRDRVSRRR